MKKKFILATALVAIICVSFTGCATQKDGEIDWDNMTDDEFESRVNAAADSYDKEHGAGSYAKPQLKEIDPFENYDVVFSGISPYITAKEKNPGTGIRYELSKENDLKNGDVVTVTAELLSYYSDEYVLTQTTKEFVVEDFPAYVERLEQIPQDVLDKMENELKNSLSAYVVTLGNSKMGEIECIGNYLLCQKDGYSYKNMVYVVFKASAEIGMQTLEPVDFYACGYFPNVLVLPDDTVSVDYSEMHRGLGEYFAINGYCPSGFCWEYDTLFSKNVTANLGDYTYESTVKQEVS